MQPILSSCCAHHLHLYEVHQGKVELKLKPDLTLKHRIQVKMLYIQQALLPITGLANMISYLVETEQPSLSSQIQYMTACTVAKVNKCPDVNLAPYQSRFACQTCVLTHLPTTD